MPRKKKEDRPQSPDPALLNLQAEPPADDAYEAFESEIPAYLLAKVNPLPPHFRVTRSWGRRRWVGKKRRMGRQREGMRSSGLQLIHHSHQA